MKKTKKCYLCLTEISRVDNGLNKKLLGRETTRLYCIGCLAEYLDVEVDDLLSKVNDFKLQGCKLFD